MRTALAVTALCALIIPIAQAAPAVRWRLATDADGNGVADGWTAVGEPRDAAFCLPHDRTGAATQQVIAARAGNGITRQATGLDPRTTYLLTVAVTVTRGGVLWGPEGIREKYLAPYDRLIESRVTFTGREAVTVRLVAAEPDTTFSVDSVRIEPISRDLLPVEADTGRFLIPRPRSLTYQPGEPLSFTLSAETPAVVTGLNPDSVGLELFRDDLRLPGPAPLLEPAALTPSPALIIGTSEGLRSLAPSLSPALARALDECPTNLPAEACCLIVEPTGVLVVASTGAAAQYALQTLRQLCVAEGDGRYRVPRLRIEDEPSMPFRGTYQLGAIATSDRLAMARYYARLKLNAVVIEDDVFYHLHEGDNLSQVRSYFDALRSLHLEPIPLVQSFGWGMYVLATDPQCVEARYIQDRPMQFVSRDDVAPEVRPQIPGDGREYLFPPEDIAPLPVPFTNPSFESIAPGQAPGWQADRWGGANGATVVATGAGGHCLQLTRGTKGVIRVQQDVELPIGRELRFSVNLKLQGVDGAGAYAEIYKLTENHELLGNPVAMTPWVTGTRDWQRYSVDLETGNHRWYRIYLRIQDASGTAWFDDLQVTSASAQLRNIVHADESLRLTDEAGTLLIAGQDYEIIPGETRFPFAAEALPWQFVRLPGGSIPSGGRVLLSYEYAPAGAVTYCPSNPRTQAIMRDALGTVARELGVRRIHIGHDEPRWLNTCRRCRERGLTNAALFADELTRMRRFVTEANPDVRVMMWADALNPFHNAPAQQLEPANDTTPRDLIQCTWFYAASDDVVEARSLDYMASRGYETTGSPWFDLENNWDWSQECDISRQMTGKCLGMLYTSWADNPSFDPWGGLSVTAAFCWNPDHPLALEMLPWSPAEMNRTRGLLP